MYESMQPQRACTPGERIRRKEESGKGVKSVAGLLVTSPRDIASAISGGEAKPLHHVKVARHRRGDRGEPWCATPPRGLAYTTVIPCHFPGGAGEIRGVPTQQGKAYTEVIPLPARGVGIGWGGSPKEDPGGRRPGGWRLGLGGEEAPKRTRGAGAPGGGGWDWVGRKPQRGPGGEPRGGGHHGFKKEVENGDTPLKKQKPSGAPPLPRRDGRQRPRSGSMVNDHLHKTSSSSAFSIAPSSIAALAPALPSSSCSFAFVAFPPFLIRA